MGYKNSAAKFSTKGCLVCKQLQLCYRTIHNANAPSESLMFCRQLGQLDHLTVFNSCFKKPHHSYLSS